MIKVTLSRWKYNNSDYRITKDSEYEELFAVGKNCAEVMEKVENARFFHNLAVYTPLQIINIEDV